MPPSNAIAAHGTQFAVSTTLSSAIADEAAMVAASYTNISEVKAINGIALKADVAEVTTMLSNQFKEYIRLNKEMPQITLDVNYLPADVTHNNKTSGSMGKDLLDGNTRVFRCTFSDSGATKWYFRGFSVSVSPAIQQGEVLTGQIVIQPTAVPYFP